MIRPAAFEDMDEIVRLARQMHGESRYQHMPFAGDLLAETAGKLIVHDGGFATVGEIDGRLCSLMLAGISERWFTYDLMAFEYGVYVEPEERGGLLGVRMIQSFANWAKALGVKYITLGVTTGINDEVIGKIYQRMGFELVGAVYAREG